MPSAACGQACSHVPPKGGLCTIDVARSPGREGMPIRRGEEYLESLRDGRRVWLMGHRVEDVTAHPALAGCARSVADVYDLQHDPAHRELLTIASPSTSQPVSAAYLLPRSVDDLARQRRMYECLVRRAGGV